MLTNTGPLPKLYLSIIDDVIESMRELFMDEGLEDRVLDDLRRLWESKMMQSKVMQSNIEGFRRDGINSSNFVLQLPASYVQTVQKPTATVVIPAGQNIHSFPAKVELQNSSGTLATFSLPSGVTYPVQIPAGATLQTASGQFYKVNVPVMVTQALAGPRPFFQPAQPNGMQQREAPIPQLPIVPPVVNNGPPQKIEPCPVPVTPAALLPEPQSCLTLEGNEVVPQPVNMNMESSASNQLLDLHVKAEDTLTQGSEFMANEVEELLEEVIKEEERDEAVTAGTLAPPRTGNQPEEFVKLERDYHCSELSDIIQLDGPADNSDMEEEEEGLPLLENDFLGLINAEALRALQEGSSEGSSSPSSDSDGADELADAVEEDPLNSGDDVVEQDIPDLFDTDNVIVCQYDKIHRSKNRWKFYLKDGVMSYGGRDYVFSKAVGEAEW